MNKVKLTQSQVDALNNALDDFGTAHRLIKFHETLLDKNSKWLTHVALNDVTPKDLHNALKYGYEVAGKVKVSLEVEKCIKKFFEMGFSKNDILYAHEFHLNRGGWNNATELNSIDHNTLKNALEDGYEVDEQSSSHISEGDETNLAPHDYMSMIDLALATNDKVWFKELHQKMREGATM